MATSSMNNAFRTALRSTKSLRRNSPLSSCVNTVGNVRNSYSTAFSVATTSCATSPCHHSARSRNAHADHHAAQDQRRELNHSFRAFSSAAPVIDGSISKGAHPSVVAKSGHDDASDDTARPQRTSQVC